MASKSIIAKGTTYNGVESVTFPVSGGGDATFYEISDTTAAASDVASSKWFYTALGQYTQGTASGGGGGSSYTLLKSEEVELNVTSTSNITVATISCGAQAYTSNKILYIKVRDKAGPRSGYYYGSDVFMINPFPANGVTTTCNMKGMLGHRVDANGYVVFTTQYGVYGYSVNSSGDVVMYGRYNSSITTDINGTFVIEIYLLDFVDSSPFV